MRTAFLVVLVLWPLGSSRLLAENKLTASTLQDFLARYDQNFSGLQSAFTELSNEHIPLLRDSGQALTRRHVEDRRKSLTALRETSRRLAANPKDLVLALTLMLRTETLADDLYDLSQLAYDNDREELGKNLADFQVTMDNNKDLLEAYVLDLAGDEQERLQQLTMENESLKKKLEEAASKPQPSPPASPGTLE